EADWGSASLVPHGDLALKALDPSLAGRVGRSHLPVLFSAATPSGGPTGAARPCGVDEVGLDVFGTAFFLLSRYEEWVAEARDEHDRFPYADLLAERWRLADDPTVDEYVEALWWSLERVWPRLE